MRTRFGTNYNCGGSGCSARKPMIPSIVEVSTHGLSWCFRSQGGEGEVLQYKPGASDHQNRTRHGFESTHSENPQAPTQSERGPCDHQLCDQPRFRIVFCIFWQVLLSCGRWTRAHGTLASAIQEPVHTTSIARAHRQHDVCCRAGTIISLGRQARRPST